MGQFASRIAVYEQQYNQFKALETKIEKMKSQLEDMRNQYYVMLEAQQLLATVSNENTNLVLDYITGIVNKTLGELFPHDTRRVYLERTMHNNQYAHINIKLTGTNGKTRDIMLQTGTGLRQVVSFLFVLSLIEIRKGRRFLIMDEILSGVHPKALSIIQDIITIFAEEGFQFVIVDYGLDCIGRIYLVEKPNAVATVTPLDGKYNNQVFVFNRPPEDVDISRLVDEEYIEEDETLEV